MYNGILVLDKIYGAPSRACVTGVSRALGGRRQKVGHAGTLDTTASGALVLMLGYATRLSEAVMNLPKSYLAEVTFGWETSTDDATGEPLSSPLQVAFDEDALIHALPGFLGVRLQTPPRVSAVMVDGRRAHKIARAGGDPQIQPRPVDITAIRYLGRTEKGAARLLVDCHRGTYVRSLARDIGRALGISAHLSSLRRLNVGSFCADGGLVYNPQDPPTAAQLTAHIQPVSALAEQYYSYDTSPFCEKRLADGLCVYLDFMKRRSAGVVPVEKGIMALGEKYLCLGRLGAQKGRAVLCPQANIRTEVRL
ncbi:MAG: tRNA pseudouridine(55) synthase TruB [Pyramidobacter sp.]